MLRSLKDLDGYGVSATDGELGHVVDFLLDDQQWRIRYLVVKTGGFLGGLRVLLSPISFREADRSTRRFHVALTRDKVRTSPSVDVDKPVSRQYERDYHQYYGYPYYWGPSGLSVLGIFPGGLEGSGLDETSPKDAESAAGDHHLRSAAEVRGYHIQGSDEEIGHVADFVVDDATWAVRYIAIDTSNWWLGNTVLIAPQWTRSVSWSNRTVYVDMSREAIKDSPEWDATAAINREYEEQLYDYYERPAYWGIGHRVAAGEKDLTGKAATKADVAEDAEHATAPNPPRTTSFGWLTTPKFGSAASGGGEIEPGPERD